MKTYNVTIKLIAPYLQAKFGDEAKEGLKVRSGNKSKIDDDDSWKKLMYSDEKGVYIPSEQIEGALMNGGKAVKRRPMGSFKDKVKAYCSVSPARIYIKKDKPDFIKTSYPSRKDGMRVKLMHPAWNEGLQVSFELNVYKDEIFDNKTLLEILEKAGLEGGIGAWRPKHGRFEVVEVK